MRSAHLVHPITVRTDAVRNVILAPNGTWYEPPRKNIIRLGATNQPRRDSVSVKLVSTSLTHPPALFGFSGICRKKESEPPRTRTWNLEIKRTLRPPRGMLVGPH